MRSTILLLLAALLLIAPSVRADDESKDKTDEVDRIASATTVIKEMGGMSQGPPRSLLENAAGVVVIPGLIKAGLGIGGQHGSGLLSIKREDGTWSEPVFVKMTGGSIGFQIGASSIDLVLFFMREKNIRDALDGEFTLGGNATVAAGPVGRSGSADTSIKLDAEIYSYSRSRGAFAGISIDGSKLYVDKSANARFHGEAATPTSTVASAGSADSPAAAFRTALAELTKPRKK